MTLARLFSIVDELMPDLKILEDFTNVIQLESQKQNQSEYFYITLEDGERLTIPCDVKAEIITKVAFKEYTSYFTNAYRILIAVGGVDRDVTYMVSPNYCFANFYYDDNGILMDFHFSR